MQRLKDKVAIVTGSSSGIGKVIALRFGAEGTKLAGTLTLLADLFSILLECVAYAGRNVYRAS